jgi:hypothetical protein
VEWPGRSETHPTYRFRPPVRAPSRRMAEGTQLGMALEGLTAADLAQHQD